VVELRFSAIVVVGDENGVVGHENLKMFQAIAVVLRKI
jgi:ribosomal protein S5